jgi:hypothetical protein
MKIESMVTITGAEYEALRAEIERLKAVNALMEYAAFPSAEDAKEAETWIAANPGRPLSDYCPPGGLLVKRLTAENERLQRDNWRLKGNMAARLADHINGTPCAEIRWQQERETLEDEIRRLRSALETVRDEYGYTFPTDTNQMIAAALTQEPRT